ncbi:Hypothetical protein, putative [Bodo saltans]|uniref:Uncharacterized protein n=1 Tax=Bodo saltans TaxID=75058 RepID=A0A0S4JPW4_BODSA|nr:Hypothetical protein, putative [Bodo saltans]|eukprot:CUG93580.1 Hypothetical protein, putative [Bodo saltans]
MAYVATSYVWGTSSFATPPVRYEATEAARVAAEVANQQQEDVLNLSVGVDPLSSPTGPSRTAKGCMSNGTDDDATNHSYRKTTSASSPQMGTTLNSTARRTQRSSGGGTTNNNNDRWGVVDPYGSSEFMSDAAAAAHQQWYSDKRGIAKMYVQEVSERLTLLELEERKADGLRQALLQDPLSTFAASTVLTDEQEMLLQSLRLRMSVLSNDDEEGLEDWAFTVDPVTNKRIRRGVKDMERVRLDRELDQQVASLDARMDAVRATRRRKHHHSCESPKASSTRSAPQVVMENAAPEEWYE